MLPLLMVAIVVFGVLAAGAISIGRKGVMRRELQNAADAVALEGAYRMERYGLPNNRERDVAPAVALAQGNRRNPVRVHWRGWGDEGARPHQYAYVRIDVEADESFQPTSRFAEVLSLGGAVRASAHARVDEDVFEPGELHCMILSNRFTKRPLGCRVQLSRAVTDQYQLTPHAYRRDGSGREERVPLQDFAHGWLYLDVAECERFVALRNLSCAPRGGARLVVRYNRPVLVP